MTNNVKGTALGYENITKIQTYIQTEIMITEDTQITHQYGLLVEWSSPIKTAKLIQPKLTVGYNLFKEVVNKPLV